MRALTICQPYATLILEGTKRVENRTWETKYRGRLYIHAGRDRRWLSLEDRNGVEFDAISNRPVAALPFGAVIAIASLVDCVPMDDIEAGKYDDRFPWLRTHEHAIGPWCWIVERVTAVGPVPWKGRQGLFDIHPADIERATRSFQDMNAAGPEDVAHPDQ